MPANLDPTTVSSISHANSPRVSMSKLSSLSSSAQLSDPQASASPSTPFANLSLLSPTVPCSSSNSSPLSPKLLTLTSSFLSITSTPSPDEDSCGPMHIDTAKDPHDSGLTPCSPPLSVRSSSPQSLASSESLRRVQSPPHSRESPTPASSSHRSLGAPGSLVDSDPPPAPPPPLAASMAPVPVPAKVKMSLKDFAMRKKKQREEERARAAALPPEPMSKFGESMAVVASDPRLNAACNAVIVDGSSEATMTGAATSGGLSESTAAVNNTVVPTALRGAITQVDPESSLYDLSQINGVHFDASLASTLAEIVHAIPPGKGCQSQDDVGAMKGSTPVTHGVICNDETGEHLNSVSPRSSRTPSPSLTDSEDSETGASMTRGVPPTQPRSFAINTSPVLSSSTLPHRLPPSSTYRPGSSYVPPSIPASVRPLPSGPRALRAMGGFPSQPPASFATARGYPPGRFAGVPRGPSVDRDRDRGWAGMARGRGRGTATPWGR